MPYSQEHGAFDPHWSLFESLTKGKQNTCCPHRSLGFRNNKINHFEWTLHVYLKTEGDLGSESCKYCFTFFYELSRVVLFLMRTVMLISWLDIILVEMHRSVQRMSANWENAHHTFWEPIGTFIEMFVIQFTHTYQSCRWLIACWRNNGSVGLAAPRVIIIATAKIWVKNKLTTLHNWPQNLNFHHC